MSLACRPGCGACCIAPSISSPIPGAVPGVVPGLSAGKAAGSRCVQLDDELRCRIFTDPRRPAVCAQLQASREMCGDHREAALAWLSQLEQATAPDV